MKKTKIYSGCYLIEDDGGIWIARKNGNWWTAYDTHREIYCSTLNNWGVSFRTLKALLDYSQNPTSKAII